MFSETKEFVPSRVLLTLFQRDRIFGRDNRHLREIHQATPPVEHAIVFYAGWLGHYVADGSQPLHTTIHYNGWVGPNPNSYSVEHNIHARFETAYVAQNITVGDFAKLVHAPERIVDPFDHYVDYLRQSNKLIENVYILDKVGGFTGKGSAEGFEFTTGRLAAGAQMLLDLWYTAWLDSAPDTDGTLSLPMGNVVAGSEIAL